MKTKILASGFPYNRMIELYPDLIVSQACLKELDMKKCTVLKNVDILLIWGNKVTTSKVCTILSVHLFTYHGRKIYDFAISLI